MKIWETNIAVFVNMVAVFLLGIAFIKIDLSSWIIIPGGALIMLICTNLIRKAHFKEFLEEQGQNKSHQQGRTEGLE